MTDIQETFHPIKEFSLFVRENSFDGRKKTIICIHGIGVSGHYFLPLFSELTERYNVIILDFPGYGKAPKPHRPLTIAELSLLTEQFIIERNLQGCILVGQSMGCQIIADVLARNEHIVSKAILIAPTVNRFERSIFLQAIRLLQDSTRESFTANKIIFKDYLKMGIMRYLQTTRWMIADKIENHLYDIATPVLLVRGTRDVIVPRRWLLSLRSRSDTMSIAEIPGAAHAAHFDYAKKVATVCAEFIEK